jgi:uncharacterized FlgJ-related protein
MKFILDIVLDYKFLIGIFLAVPLSVIANLLTPRIEKFLSNHSNKYKRKQTIKVRKEYQQIKIFKENRDVFLEYLIIFVVKILVLGFFAISIYFLFNNPSSPLSFPRAFVALFNSFTLIMLLIAVNLGLKVLDIYENVKNFDSYQESLSDFLLDKEDL